MINHKNQTYQVPNNHQISNSKPYDLEERTYQFSRDVLILCQTLPKETSIIILIKQLIRSATSIGANYREANETQTKKEFRHRIQIARKEAKETAYWLKLLADVTPSRKDEIFMLEMEATELVKILASIGVKAK